MLGINGNGNNWKFIIANFFVMFFGQIIWELFDLLPKGSFPSLFEFYKAVLSAATSTLIIYGINKAMKKEET